MKNLIYYVLIICSNCFAQTQNLIPADLKSKTSVLNDYYSGLLPILHTGFENSIVQYTKIPSFSIEQAFSCQTRGNKKFIISNTLTKSYWYTENKNNVKLKTHTVYISDELFELVESLFKIVSTQILIPEDEIYGLDGETYYFEIFEKTGKSNIGQTWSPNENSPMGRLTSIGENLYQLGNGQKFQVGFIETKINSLISELRK